MMKETMLNDDYEVTKDILLNRFQTLFTMCLPRIQSSTNIGGRGVGKSSLIALLIRHIVNAMPRSMWAIQGATFQQLMTRTLPGTFAFLEFIGFKRDVDYFINKFPPGHIDKPFHSPMTPENCIFFVNHQYKCAVGFSLFSQDRSSSRGPSRAGIICDESLLLDWDKFTQESLATVRGHKMRYPKVSVCEGVFHFTSMPLGESKLFEHGNYYKNSLNYRTLNDQRIDLQFEFMESKSHNERLQLWQEIDNLSDQLKYYPSKNGMLYTEFNSFDNIENLGLRYLQQQFDSMPKPLFLIEMLNKRISQIVDCFYPGLDRKKHGYTGKFNYSYLDSLDFFGESKVSLDSRQDEDCITNQSLHIGLDFGAAINWFITAQYNRAEHKLNFINNHYVKSPKIIDDVAKMWCDYYEHHTNRVVYLYPGADGFNRQPNKVGQTSYINQISAILRKRKWHPVVKKNYKQEYSHHEKYLCWARSLSQGDKRYPTIGINLVNCQELFFIMEQSPAKDYGGKIQKDKSSEKNLKANREQATDAGDAADQILYTLFGRLNQLGGEAPAITNNSL